MNDGAHAYTFDAENRILKVDSTAATYTYNPIGNRVRKDVGATSTEYFYFGSEIIAELNPATGVFTNYVYFNGGRVARRDPSGSVFYYFTDLIHSSSVVTDSGGTIKAESDYYPWGGELQLVNNDTNHYKFSGKERDSESQLDFFGARYYGNALGPNAGLGRRTGDRSLCIFWRSAEPEFVFICEEQSGRESGH